MRKKCCRQDRAKAVEILVKDLKVFAAFNEELFKEITQLLTLDNFRFGQSSLEFYFSGPGLFDSFLLAYDVSFYAADIMNSYLSMGIQNLLEE